MQTELSKVLSLRGIPTKYDLQKNKNKNFFMTFFQHMGKYFTLYSILSLILTGVTCNTTFLQSFTLLKIKEVKHGQLENVLGTIKLAKYLGFWTSRRLNFPPRGYFCSI